MDTKTQQNTESIPERREQDISLETGVESEPRPERAAIESETEPADVPASASVVDDTDASSKAAASVDPETIELKKIENTLSEGLIDAFSALPPKKQAVFKQRGEETAVKLRVLLKKAHVKLSEVVSLIFQWLKTLPGVNKFFVEQQAIIKAQRLYRDPELRERK